MKLRIRYKSVTKTLSLPDGTDYTVGHLKSSVQQELVAGLQLPAGSSFELSLNGRSSVGPDELRLSSVGIVSGDLVKIILSGGSSSVPSEPSPADPMEQEAAANQPSSSSSQSPAIDSPRGGAVLLQDYRSNQPLPPTLRGLFELPAVTGPFHAVCMLFHNLMLESGFLLQPANQPHSELMTSALSSPIFTVEYSHPGTQSLVFMLSCNAVGPFVSVNGYVRPCVNTEEQVFTLQVKLSDYVDSFSPNAKAEGRRVYKKVGTASRVFKEAIAHKALNAMREELKLPPLHGILSLFPELILRILSGLSAAELCAISQTCRTLRDVAGDDLLWRPLFKRDFLATPAVRGGSWKETYKQRHTEQQRAERERIEREREFQHPPPFHPYPDTPVMLPQPGQPLGMLGGDYDLDPSFPYGPFGRGRGGIPNPLGPSAPRLPGGRNPLPGSRYDPMNPFGGGFRPGRGGGMMDDDNLGMGMPQLPSRQRRGFGGSGGGFGGGFM